MRHLLQEFAVAVVVIFVIVFLLHGGQMQEVFSSSSEKLLELVAVAFVFLGYAAFRRRRELLFVFELHEQFHGPLAEINFALLRREMERFGQTLLDLRSRSGLRLKAQELDRFASAFFEINRGRQYIGIGTTLPSQFEVLYPTYLTQQILSQKKGDGNPDYRVIMADPQALLNDFALHPQAVTLFFERHQDAEGGICLLQVEESVALMFPQLQQLRSTEVGVWQFGLACWFCAPSEPSGYHEVSVTPTRDVSEVLNEYFIRINESARRIVLKGGKIEFRERARDEKQQDESNIRRVFFDR